MSNEQYVAFLKLRRTRKFNLQCVAHRFVTAGQTSQAIQCSSSAFTAHLKTYLITHILPHYIRQTTLLSLLFIHLLSAVNRSLMLEYWWVRRYQLQHRRFISFTLLFCDTLSTAVNFKCSHRWSVCQRSAGMQHHLTWRDVTCSFLFKQRTLLLVQNSDIHFILIQIFMLLQTDCHPGIYQTYPASELTVRSEYSLPRCPWENSGKPKFG